MPSRLWSLNALAVELGRDRRSLERDLDELKPDEETTNSKGIDRKWRLRRVFLHLIEKATGKTRGPSLDDERARLAREQADRIALENAIERGDLVDAHVLEQRIEPILFAFRERMRAIPTKIAPRVNSERPALARDLIAAEIDAALRDIAADFASGARGEHVPDARAGASDPEPAAEPNGHAVHGSASTLKPRNKRKPRAVE